MGLFRRSRPGTRREAGSDDLRHLEKFITSRRSVEAYVEPQTFQTAMTVVLVAADGEWTRRRIEGPKAARDLGQRFAIPVYDVGVTGYPNRMREWTAKRKAAGETGVPGSSAPSD